jgi:hypothetical protein
MLAANFTTAGQQEAYHGKRQKTGTKGSGKTSIQNCNPAAVFIKFIRVGKSHHA